MNLDVMLHRSDQMGKDGSGRVGEGEGEGIGGVGRERRVGREGEKGKGWGRA